MERVLSSADLLHVWEDTQNQHPVDQALTILVATTKKTRHELANLSIGARDALLFDVRSLLFGDQLEATSDCPQCGAKAEFEFNVSTLREVDTKENSGVIDFDNGDYWVTAHLPNSRDLAATTACTNENDAKQILLEHCIERASLNGSTVSIEELPLEVIDALQKEMSKSDPQAEIVLQLNCPECDTNWSSLIDISDYLLREIAMWSQKQMWDVHSLAQAYGWTESDVLALSPVRRQFYLGAITQ